MHSDAPVVDRRDLLLGALGSAVALGASSELSAAAAGNRNMPPIIDTHMHVWADDARRYPFAHPYDKQFTEAPHKATLEMLIDDMDRHGCTHAVLVQVIYHGWDNSYVADCVQRDPRRFKAHGLIDPTDPQVADKLEYWIKERGLSGMRFSPIYYHQGKLGGDAWLDAEATHRLWRKAAELEAVLNFFIAPPQLPRLAKMAAAHRDVHVIVDHLSQMDLAATDPEPDFRRLLAMAKHPNVWVKVSELASVSKSKTYPFADAYPYVKRVYEAFGPDRLLFGTGYPGDARAAYKRPTLDKELDLFRQEMAFFSAEDVAKILGGNAAKLWGFGQR
ncbi:MAG: amidohydrolase family protein [Pirellulaceae bacterium]